MFYSVCLRSSRQAAELFRAGRAERRQRRQGNFPFLFLFRLEGTPFFWVIPAADVSRPQMHQMLTVRQPSDTDTQENTQNLPKTEESWDTLTGPEVDWKQSWEIRRTFGSNRWAETHPDVHWRARIQRKKSWDVFTMLTKWQCSKWFF